MKDRVPLYPGRVKLTPVAGQTNIYDLVRADQPKQEGTPLNKASLLTDETAAAIGLSGDPTVNNALYALMHNIQPAVLNVYTIPSSTVKATLGSTTVTAISNVQGKATLGLYQFGTWTVTVTTSSTTVTKSLVVDKISTYTLAVVQSLQETSWATISALADAGVANEVWSVGDTKNITVNGTSYVVQIIGFNHDTKTDGNKAGITFQMVDCLATKYKYNNTTLTSYTWTKSTMRTSTLPSIFKQLNTDLKSVIKTVKKATGSHSYSSSSGSPTTTTETTEQLFLLASVEVTGSTRSTVTGEGTRYEWYSAGNSRVKKINGTAETWWLRSPTKSQNSVQVITTEGGESSGDPSYSQWGVAFAFCV